MQTTFSKILFNSSFFLLCALAFTLFVSNVFFLFGFSLQYGIAVISICFSFFLLFYTTKSIVASIAAVLVALLLAVASYLLATYFYDISFDGQGYHQETVYLMKNGWNPIYEKSGAFRSWIDHYQKGNEIIQANIYLLTNQLEAGKLTNALFIFIALVVVYRFLSHLKMNVILRWLISFLVVLNPVVFTQIFTYYLDGNWYLTLVIALASLLSFFVSKKPIDLVIFVMSGFIFCTLKFSSIPVFAIFSLFALVYNHQHLKMPLTKAFVGIAILVSLCSVHPFVSNVTNGYAPFYPFLGEGKKDVLGENIPTMFLNKNRLERLAMSLLSKTSNNNNAIFSEDFQLPFEINKQEMYRNYLSYDTRLGGFGFLFSGIIVFSFLIFVSLLFAKESKAYKVAFLFIFLSVLASILINPASWWPRLSPQIWLLTFVLIIFGLLSKNIASILLSQFTTLLFLTNIGLTGYITSINMIVDNKIMITFMNKVGNKTIILDLSTPHAFQQYYLKFKEQNIKYKIEKVNYKKHLAPFTKDVYYEIK